MSILEFMTSVSLAAFTVTALHGEKRCPGNVPSVPLRQVEGTLIVVPLTVNGAGPFDFLVDTGAQTTTVDEKLASELGLTISGETGVSGAGTYARKAYAQLARVEVGGRRVTDVLTVIDKLAELHAGDGRIRGIVGEDFLTHFDFLIDNEHQLLCLDESGAMAAAMKGTHVPPAQPYGTDRDLSFMQPLVIEARLDGIRDSVLFRLDSGSNAPVIYGGGKPSVRLARTNVQILKRFVNGVEQDFGVLPPTDVSFGREAIRQVIFVQTMNSIGAVHQAREDGVLPTRMFRRMFVSYSNQFAILDPR
jgi:predicted aspartyl protease